MYPVASHVVVIISMKTQRRITKERVGWVASVQQRICKDDVTTLKKIVSW